MVRFNVQAVTKPLSRVSIRIGDHRREKEHAGDLEFDDVADGGRAVQSLGRGLAGVGLH
jgi:hypothetical protein